MNFTNLVTTFSRVIVRPNGYFRILGKQINSSGSVKKFDLCRNFSSLTQNDNLIVQKSRFLVTQNNLVIKRNKKSKKSSSNKSADRDEEEEEEDDDDSSNENPLLMDDILGSQGGTPTQEVDVNSLRLDSVAKVAFKMTRARIEELFYKGDIYLNGQRPSKKSCDISEGDEIDIIRQINQEDHTMVDMRRVQILKMPDKGSETGRMKLKVSTVIDLTLKNPEHRENES